MNALVLCLAVPTAGAALILLLRGLPVLRDAALVGTALSLFATVLSLLPALLAGANPATPAWTVLPGLDLQLVLEPLGMLFALVASGLWVVNALYSIGYMRANEEPRQAPFHAWFALSLAATMGIALAGNLFTLFLFYELLTLLTWPLVTHRRDAAAIAGGRTYLLWLVGGSLMLFLPAIAWIALVTGRLGFAPGGMLAGQSDPSAIGVLLALIVFGVGKAAVMPMHRWLPAAMVAPTPVSALLHAVAVVKAGVFCVLKIVVLGLGVDTLATTGAAGWLPYVAGTSVILASVIALRQDDLKRRLAYSTVSQLSYVVLAVSLLNGMAITAAALHIAAHAVGKITLFFVAGAIYTTEHRTRVSELDGIGRRMPWTMTAFAIGALSMIGVPPCAGFISKWFLVSGAIAAEQWFVLGVVAASTLLTAGYFLPILHAAFLRPAPAGVTSHGEAPALMLGALVVTAGLTIGLFLYPAPVLTLARLFSGLT